MIIGRILQDPSKILARFECNLARSCKILEDLTTILLKILEDTGRSYQDLSKDLGGYWNILPRSY